AGILWTSPAKLREKLEHALGGIGPPDPPALSFHAFESLFIEEDVIEQCPEASAVEPLFRDDHRGARFLEGLRVLELMAIAVMRVRDEHRRKAHRRELRERRPSGARD